MTPISDLVLQLRERGVSRVALQFPAGLKRRSWEIAEGLREAGFEVFVSGDPCYGACDLSLDLLSVADVLVHFGHTPLGDRDDVIFEPFYTDIEVDALDEVIPLLGGKKTGLVTTAQHAHQIEEMRAYLEAHGIKTGIADGGGRTPLPGQVLGCSFQAARVPGAEVVLYVGTGLFHPTGIQLATGSRVIALDPFTRAAVEIDASRMKRRRCAVIERARNAKRIAILVSLKSGQQRLDLARRLAALSDLTLIVMMREICPDELLNLGCDACVNTACPRLAYDDQKRFPVPVLSPMEFEILCGSRTWEEFAIDEL